MGQKEFHRGRVREMIKKHNTYPVCVEIKINVLLEFSGIVGRNTITLL